jgi:hypothetical protein
MPPQSEVTDQTDYLNLSSPPCLLWIDMKDFEGSPIAAHSAPLAARPLR